MPDLPVVLPRPDLAARLAVAADAEGKLPRALAELAPIAGRDVVLVGDAESRTAAELAERGGRVRAVTLEALGALELDSADVIVAPWVGFTAGDDAFERELVAAQHVARSGGRLLVVQDYGRDDVRPLVGTPRGMSARPRDRDDWFLRRGFRIRVLHCWWTFDSLEDARSFLEDAFGDAGANVGASLARPRLAHKIVVYHRDL